MMIKEKQSSKQELQKDRQSKGIPKKVLRVLSLVIAFVFVLMYLLIALLNTTLVQSFTAAKVADFFSKQWDTKVSIGALNVSPFITVGIKDIYVEDLQKDTLASISYLEANLSKIKNLKHIVVKNVAMEDLTCHLNNSQSGMNFKFIIDYFKSDKKKEKREKKEPFILEIKDIDLENINFRLRNLKKNTPIEKHFFASNHIEITNSNLKAKNFVLRGGDIEVEIEKMNFKERCGLEVQDLRGKAKVSSSNIYLHNSEIVTNNTKLKSNIDLHSNTYKTYSSFLDSVYMQVDFSKDSYVGMQDVAYFSKQFEGAKQRIFTCLEAEGVVENLEIKNLEIKSNATQIKTRGTLKNITKINDAFADLIIDNVNTSYSDITNQSLGKFTGKIPDIDIVKRAGNVAVKGEFKGKIKDFQAKLNLISDVGQLYVTARSESQKSYNAVRYIAQVESNGVNLGKLLNNKLLGMTSLDSEANIVLDKKHRNGNLVAKLRNFYFKDNFYDQIQVQGALNNYDVDIDLDIQDEYAQVKAVGRVNYQNKPSITLQAQASQVDLYNMHLYTFVDTTTIISSDIYAQIQDFDINKLNGEIDIKHFNVINAYNDVTLNGLNINMNSDEASSSIKIKSDIFDADFEGRYTIETLQKDFAFIFDKYIPDFSFLKAQEEVVNKEKKYIVIDSGEYDVLSDMDFVLNIKDVEILRKVFDLNINLDKNIDIRGKLNKEDILYTEVNIPQLKYFATEVTKGKIRVEATKQDMALSIEADTLTLSKNVALKNLGLRLSNAPEDNMVLLAKFRDVYDSTTDGRIEFDLDFLEDKMSGYFKDTYFNFMGKRIAFNNGHIIEVKNNGVDIYDLIITADNKSKVAFNGHVSDRGSLTCSFDNFDISLANMFLEESNIELQGFINNDIELKNITNGLTFTSNLQVKDLSLNSTPIGNALINVTNAVAPNVFNADVRLFYDDKDKALLPLQIMGTITPQSEQEQMNLNISMEQFDLSIIEEFVSSFASDLDGYLSCKNLKVSGKFSSPEIEGKIHTDNAVVQINMLGTKFYFTDDIEIDRNKLSFDNFVLQDAEKNTITINGEIAHKDFSTFDMDLKVRADKIKILDTKEESEQMYYGTAYASGVVNIKGDSTMLDISGSVRTEPGTSLTVPVSNKESVEENNFIVFYAGQDSNTIEEKTINNVQKNSLAYNIALDLAVNSNAKLFLPIDFSQVKGDLSAAGDGDIKIKVNKNGQFSMEGTVAIDNGSFKLNVADVMEKNFDLERGGTLSWDGNPAGGVLDVSAVYKTNISLASLLGESYSKPVAVESIIKITGPMTNPQPKFDIQLPNVDKQTEEQVFMNIDRTDEKVMIEQTASILLTNQFYLSQGGYQTNVIQSGVTSSVMGVAFSQISGMLSNMIRFVDVKLNYTSGDEIYGGQMDADFSKTIGKWDLSINASLGGDGTTNKATETSNIIGDATATYSYTNNLKIEVFNRSNANDFTKYNVSPYTQGAKIIYKRDYNSIKDIFIRKRKKDNLLP